MLSCEEFFKALDDQKEKQAMQSYVTRNGKREINTVLGLINVPLSDDLLSSVPEPNVTNQIMVLEEVTYTIL